MGLLSKLTRKVTPTRRPGDDTLLLHAMLLMCCADGVIDAKELPLVEAFFATLPEFAGKVFDDVYKDATALCRRYPTPRDSVQALAKLSSQAERNKCYLLAADIAMSSGDVDEAEDAMLEAMQKVLQVQDTTATKILEVLAIKYARA